MNIRSVANEKEHQTVYFIRRWYFFKEFLVTLVQSERFLTGILRFLGLKELYVPMMSATGQL